MKKYFLVFVLIIQGTLVLIIDNYLDRRNKEKLDQFKHNVSELLGDAKEVVVPASRLTDFSWRILCFQRIDSYFKLLGDSFIELTFVSRYSKVVLNLDYKKYYVDESYVEGSLDRKCISNQDSIMIKNFGYINFFYKKGK